MSDETKKDLAAFDKAAVEDGNQMSNNQALFFGVHTVNVQAEAAQTANAVKVPVNIDAQMTATSDAMMKDAPNLAFKLPFHLEHLFGCHDADKEP